MSRNKDSNNWVKIILGIPLFIYIKLYILCPLYYYITSYYINYILIKI